MVFFKINYNISNKLLAKNLYSIDSKKREKIIDFA